MVDDAEVENAYHRLDAAFLALSDEAVRVRPTARVHLYRVAAARLWMAPLDARAELTAAARLAERPEDVSLAAAFEPLLTGRAAAAAESFVAHMTRHPDDALAHGLRTAALVMSGVKGDRERAFALTEQDAPHRRGDWRFDAGLAMVRQEQRRYDEARELSQDVLAQEPRAAHAVHVLTHVNYETGEHAAGIRWLDDWQAGRPMLGYATHFRWHTALHALALGDVDDALARYRDGIGPAAVADAGSLLWRCRLAGARVTDVAVDAERAAAPVLAALPIAFAVFNASLALAAADDSDALRSLAARLAGDARPAYADVVAPLVSALAAVVDGRPDDAVERLQPVLAHAARLGGSNAQREVVEDTYIHALVSCGRVAEATSLIRQRLDRRSHALDLQLATFQSVPD